MVGLGDCMAQYVYQKAKLPAVTFQTGTSVTNADVYAIGELGCDTIIFTGQDMCLYGKKLHADGSDQIIDDRRVEIYEKKDIYGNNVLSPLGYYTIKLTLEDAVRYYKGCVKFVNATEGGLGIDGVENVPLQEVLDSLPDTLRVDKELAFVLEKAPVVELKPRLLK